MSGEAIREIPKDFNLYVWTGELDRRLGKLETKVNLLISLVLERSGRESEAKNALRLLRSSDVYSKTPPTDE